MLKNHLTLCGLPMGITAVHASLLHTLSGSSMTAFHPPFSVSGFSLFVLFAGCLSLCPAPSLFPPLWHFWTHACTHVCLICVQHVTP